MKKCIAVSLLYLVLCGCEANSTLRQAEPAKSEKPVVTGIIYSTDNPCAVVDNRIVSVGDVADGATIVKINPSSVEFEMDGKKWTQIVNP
jgi:hypothetical protein